MNLASILAVAHTSAAQATPEALETAGVLIALDAVRQPSDAATTAFAALDAPTRSRYRAGDTFRHNGADYRLERPTVALRQVLRCPKTWARIQSEEAEAWAALGSVETPLGAVPWMVLISFAGVAMLPLPGNDAEDLRYEIETRPSHPKLRALIAAWGRSQESERARAAEELRRPDVTEIHVAAVRSGGASRFRTLDALVGNCMTPDELHRFLGAWEDLVELRASLPSYNGVSPAAYTDALIGLLKRRGLTASFLTKLCGERPNRAAEIRAWM